jgi:tetratricopeptide (TPR) repeat protein
MPVRRLLCIVTCCGIALFFAKCLRSGAAPADKPETWIEAATPHFTVMSDDGERTARRIAQQFEQIRILYSKALSPNLRLDPGIPIVILAARNEKSLSQILPEYWAQKGHTHPPGLFLPGSERNYIALRTDMEGEFPYLIVYHEYVHLIVNLNYQHIPLWLNEGYATFLGSAKLLPKSGRLGLPNESELNVLQQTKLLPLEVLFRVGPDSPYYNEEKKTNVFYAESWALVHYLITDASRQKDHQLGKYITLMESGNDPVDAAKSAFGDLGQLKKQLDSYVSRTAYAMFVVSLPDPVDSNSFPVRVVPPAEVQATLGEFDISRRQFETARAKIEEALRVDPNSAAAQESMGLLLFREEKRSEAQKYFSRAAALDSKSALAYFYDGMLLVSGGAEEEDMDEAQAALEKAVALKPELAPAWDALASLYAIDPQNMNKARDAAERAVKAMPGDPRYRFNLAVVLLRMGKFEDARAIAQGIVNSRDLLVASRAKEFLEQIARVQQSYSSPSNELNTLARPEMDRDAKETDTPETIRPAPAAKSGTAEQPATPATASHVPTETASPREGQQVNVTSTHVYSMMGKITAVTCSNPPQMQITLQGSGIVMHLHAADILKIEFRAEAGNPSAAKLSCAQFAGKRARITYQLTSQKPWDGEMVSIELQSAP